VLDARDPGSDRETMYADLAKVLTAAAHIAGLSKRDLRGLNADSLKTLEARQKKNK
jgi:hypothetical protein